MLFNSYPFLFVFLPITLLGFFGLARWDRRFAAVWLALASVAFYAWWDVRFLPVLACSILWNFSAGCVLYKLREPQHAGSRRFVLILAIVGNLLALGYYKYANFVIGIAGDISGRSFGALDIVLPLGISFFTFTQIAFLVDTAQGKVKEFNVAHYVLFVSYFPHLIAGPILHHKQMMPQFADPAVYKSQSSYMSIGVAYFVIGLIKKCVLADGFGPDASAIFATASKADAIGALAAWKGALAYTLQLYFDFSGYVDMAIGLSLLFGIRLPLNFNSPYRATSIIEFWRRWHMTLSTFLRDYLYIPLGGNKHGGARRYCNLLATMLLGGLWHGANWTFIAWGGLHGAFLIVNHGWRALKSKLPLPNLPALLVTLLSTLLTFLAVMIGWVFFRAPDIATALKMLSAMAGSGGLGANPASSFSDIDLFLMMAGVPNSFARWNDVLLYVGGLAIVFFLPNSQQLVERSRYAITGEGLPLLTLRWRPNLTWAIGMGTAAAACLTLFLSTSEFLYFQF